MHDRSRALISQVLLVIARVCFVGDDRGLAQVDHTICASVRACTCVLRNSPYGAIV